jgi:hypothetical protein
MNAPVAVNLVVRILLATALFAGCASLPSSPPTPITSMSQIEGKWQGTITLGFAGPQQFYEITIHPDGSFVAQWGMNWQWGKVTLGGGAANFEITAPGTSTGTLKYYAGPGKRALTLNTTFDEWSANVTAVN